MDTKVHKALAAAFSVMAIAQLYLVVGLFNQTVTTVESSYLSASLVRPMDRTTIKARQYRANMKVDPRAVQFMRTAK